MASQRLYHADFYSNLPNFVRVEYSFPNNLVEGMSVLAFTPFPDGITVTPKLGYVQIEGQTDKLGCFQAVYEFGMDEEQLAFQINVYPGKMRTCKKELYIAWVNQYGGFDMFQVNGQILESADVTDFQDYRDFDGVDRVAGIFSKARRLNLTAHKIMPQTAQRLAFVQASRFVWIAEPKKEFEAKRIKIQPFQIERDYNGKQLVFTPVKIEPQTVNIYDSANRLKNLSIEAKLPNNYHY